MEPAAAALIGAGFACVGMGGAAVGLGHIFGNFLAGALRNPSAADGQFGRLIFAGSQRSTGRRRAGACNCGSLMRG